ncbi:MAG: flagellar basal body P-ring protein FlgI [Candidatus Coatesbacteria bacterium]
MTIRRFACSALLLAVVSTGLAATAAAVPVKVRDVVDIQGARENQLIGYGIVVGLPGTGDTVIGARSGTIFTVQSIINMLKRFGIVVPPQYVRVRNVAAVMVTASLPPYLKGGNKLDVVVSSLGDARSLRGGNLLQTPLQGADGTTYAVAQGPITVDGGLRDTPTTPMASTNRYTTARLPGGGIVEREVPATVFTQGEVTLLLKQPDYTACTRISDVINKTFLSTVASPLDASSIKLRVPSDYGEHVVEFISAVTGLEYEAPALAKVVINERTGTIVMGSDVRVSSVAVAHGTLHLMVRSERQSVLTEDAESTTVRTTGAGNLIALPEGANIAEVVDALNAIGATPHEMVAVLQMLRAAGALQAEVVSL